jgi:hypothetical protein
MKPMTLLATLIVALFAAGCTAMPEQHAGSSKIAVWESYPQDPRPYKQIKRVWADSWRSNFWAPQYASVEDGANAMREHAVALGGDGVMNFGCYRQDANIPHAEQPALYCNGTVIKFL